MKKINIYSDGICYGNPGTGGYGVVIESNGEIWDISEGVRDTTSNRMKLAGVIAAFRELTEPCNITVYIDSQYVVNGINNNWAKSWQKHNWTSSSKTPVKNSDLWEELLKLVSKHNVKFIWMRGSNGYKYKARCVRLASEAVDNEIF